MGKDERRTGRAQITLAYLKKDELCSNKNVKAFIRVLKPGNARRVGEMENGLQTGVD